MDDQAINQKISAEAESLLLKQRIRELEASEREHRLLEEAFRTSEIRYRTLFETTGTTMLIIEDDMTISLTNDGFEKLTGCKREEVEGKRKWSEFVAEGDLEEMIAQHKLRRTDSEAAKREYEFRLVHRDGFLRHILLTADLIPGTRRSVASLIDITDRKNAETALKEDERRFRELIDFLPIPVFEMDTEGNVLSGNRAIFEAFLYERPDLEKGLHIRQMFSPEDLQRIRTNAQVVLQGGKTKGPEYTGIRKDGSTFPLMAFTSPIIRDHRPIGLRGAIINLTELKQAEEERQKLKDQLQRSEKMEALGTLAGGVAHDLNNVIGVLVGYSEILQRKLPAESPLRRYADNLLQSSIKGAAIVQDLLNLTRRGVKDSQVVNLNGLVSDSLRTPEFEKMKSYHPDVTIETELDDGLLNIKGSPVHLGKALLNLVSNAAEAIEGRGQVVIRTQNRHLELPLPGCADMKEGDYVVLSVADTGGGIAAADMGRIFEPFFTKKTMGRSGTGLGLTVVWGTVKDYQGHIDVQSEEGRGSTFTLYFPATREEMKKTAEDGSIVDYMGSGETILVVDDVREQRELAAVMLEGLGYRVEAAAGGKEAVEWIRSRKADLVILDMIMEPGIDGMETYRRILEIYPGQKAIIVSGFSETDRVRKAQEMGAGEFVLKPYILERIGLAVRRELEKKR